MDAKDVRRKLKKGDLIMEDTVEEEDFLEGEEE